MNKLRLDGVIGMDDSSAESFQSRIEALNLKPEDELSIIINSEGGSVFEGFAIYNKLRALPNKINVKIEGLCGSIATLIALAADHVQMSEVALWMIHRSSSMVQGNQEELKKEIEVLENIDSTLINVYAGKTGLDKEEIEALISKETFYTAEEALKAGFIDEIVDRVEERIAAHIKINKHTIMNLKQFFAQFKETAVEETVVEVTPVETPAETTPELSLESVNERVGMLTEQISNLAAVVEGLVEAMQTEEIPTPVSPEEVETIVEARLKAQIEALPKTSGKTPQANGAFNKDANSGYTPRFPNFNAMMSQIELKTRNH